jgi:hypothetical protein
MPHASRLEVAQLPLLVSTLALSLKIKAKPTLEVFSSLGQLGHL